MPNVKIHSALTGHDVATNIVLSLIASKALAERNGSIELQDFNELGIDSQTALRALRENIDLINLTRENELPAGFSWEHFAGVKITGMKFDIELLLKAQRSLPMDGPGLDDEQDDYFQDEAVFGLAHYRARESMLDGKRVLNVSRFTRTIDSPEGNPIISRVREIWVDRPIDEGTAEEVFGNLIVDIQGDSEIAPETVEGLKEPLDYEQDDLREIVLRPGASEIVEGTPAYALVWSEEDENYLALERVDGKWLIRQRIDKTPAEDVREDWEQFLDDVWPVTHANDQVEDATESVEEEAVPVEATEDADNWPESESFVEDLNAWPEQEVRFEVTIGKTQISVEAARATEHDELRATFFDSDGQPKTLTAKFRNIRVSSGEALEAQAAEWLEKELAE